MKQEVTVHIPITMLDSIWKGDLNHLPANESFDLIIDYPLIKPAIFKIKTGKNGMGLIKLLKKIGVAYQKVYDMEDKYSIYGHDIGDLNLSGITVDFEKKKITLSVDS